MSHAITQMEKVTQGTAATAEESAAASEELHAQAETSIQVVTRLAALVGTKIDHTRAQAQPAATVSRAASANVVPLARRAKPAIAARPTAEEQIPLGDTGTYGSF